MKSPLMLPSLLCGECGIEMLLSNTQSQERAANKLVSAQCYTPRCPQKGVSVLVYLTPAPMVHEDSVAT